MTYTKVENEVAMEVVTDWSQLEPELASHGVLRFKSNLPSLIVFYIDSNYQAQKSITLSLNPSATVEPVLTRWSGR